MEESIKKEDKTPEEILDDLKDEPESPEKTIKKENKQLMNVLVGIGIFLALIIGGILFINSVRYVGYEKVDFEVVKEGDLIFYNTKIPLYDSSGKHYANHNFFLRTDPKDLREIDFDGEIEIKDFLVINSTGDFKCEGYGIIAIANVNELYTFLGTKVIKDETASCDPNGEYMYVNIKPGKKTKVEQTGASCYDIIINDCEILEGTEKFMIETFVEINKALP